MGFVNEYVSDEDIEKYDLNGIWDDYYPLYKGELFFGNKPEWTIDRERNTFLLSLEIGRGEHGNRRTFLLWLDGKQVFADVDLVGGSSGDLNADPFVIVWALVRLALPPDLGSEKIQVTQIIKEGLRVFGYWGVRRQLPNTVVTFEF